ncbi:cytochrome c oxidase assembly protein [Pararhizobium sp.]|uniref:cytochrome c oxidase assembly protein n=1 Tax=Pararhizobium sp. TaxID=1977563 RepID=UPI00271A056F|nr:cytochrome c oxidase assembly protein [Pararhizobium sp.]MDO9418504.1 cytochrome c oxidase assembly protein [Pararhizobium sp.]
MKRIWLTIGLTMLALFWGAAATVMDRASFSGHMLVHMGVVVLAAPLIALGLSGTVYDPAPRYRWFAPLPASLAELLIVWVWHAPSMRLWAETSTPAAIIEQATFLFGGVGLWLACLDRAHGRRLTGVLALLLTSMHMTLLGVLLTMAPRPLYGAEAVTCFGMVLGPEQDQQAGGVIMLALGAAAYLTGGIALLAGALRQVPSERHA